MTHVAYCAVVALVLPAATLDAQEWNVSAQAGRIRSALDPSAAAAESFALGLRRESPASWFGLSAGIPTGESEPLWGGLGVWRRLAGSRDGFTAGIDLSGNGFYMADTRDAAPVRTPGPVQPPVEPATDQSGHAIAAQALPMVGYEGVRLEIHARAGVSHYTSEFAGRALDRTVPLADLQLTYLPTSSFAIMPTVRHFRAPDEDPATYAGLTAVAASSFGSIQGSLGDWSVEQADGLAWAAGATLRPHHRFSIDGVARHDSFDPLYQQPAQTAWSVGVSVRLGERRATGAPPVPDSYVDGRATIRLSGSEAGTRPSIAGDFTDWQPAPMTRSGDDWTYTTSLTPGVYNYAFVSEDGEWFVPASVAGRRDDGMGGHVAVLVIR